ncbi:2-dehydro-3-deoxyphosphogluconate aldolase/(4S)-4-hydroxy-2-oxoglutarate aldolase [Arthrobacter pigmenti]|uniref:2-dehydro-3-deoxyphosphogluconate aldolase/(4S)-4-hydroxy-2-oxoglutarate aldolase n=1 Tax=Arthrobacter pigmenti TaxID=271432 RepID=A0A846RIK9_9MICC|nr:bifunctional 4-hydroxy-2-oxoglutarate aldolase/2-dehydro-3-deoxy-phosphogluconate aldolase [Arthrobacter pigmenti]NJC21520.1 2-dehydro-3-deoxyphosphogluconate aldolase/(4S)-4-hydroxy-2-oxoglutarate aldolase [Arthrobacter pigmenti]
MYDDAVATCAPALPVGAGVIAVLRATHASEYAPVIDSLVAGGVDVIELTLSTRGVFEELPLIRERFGDAAHIGVGTVLTTNDAMNSLDAGAEFLITPAMNLAVVEAAVQRGVPIAPGGLTPSELHAGWAAGSSAVKLFPASTVGTEYLAQLRGPFPDMQIIPSGGVGIEQAPEWIAAGSPAVSVGGPLLKDAFDGGDPAALAARARRVCALVAEAFEARAQAGV